MPHLALGLWAQNPSYVEAGYNLTTTTLGRSPESSQIATLQDRRNQGGLHIDIGRYIAMGQEVQLDLALTFDQVGFEARAIALSRLQGYSELQ